MKKIYRSTDYGAPALYGNAGYLIPVLDACLVNGYGDLSVSSLTHSGGIVTATTALAHNLQPDSRQLIAGANEVGYNGTVVVIAVTTYTFTYAATGTVTINTATGTLTTRTPPAGWSKAFSGTNLASYRMGAGNQRYLRIDDTVTFAARCLGYEAMSDVNTGTGPFPTAAQFSGGLYWTKSSTADATNARPWVIIADETGILMWVNYNSSVTNNDTPVFFFGDFLSEKDGDIYNTVLIAATAATNIANFRFSYLVINFTSTLTGIYMPRSYTQVGSSMPGSLISDAAKSAGATNMGTGGLVYPHAPNGGLVMAPVWLVETAGVATSSVIRGTLKDIWNPMHSAPLANFDTFTGAGDLAGKRFIAFRCQPSAMFMVDITN